MKILYKTLYVTGIKKYHASLEKGLAKSELVDGIDYILGSGGSDYALYWVRESLEVKEFKLAIGTKYVWKHRMRFFNTYDEMKPEEVVNGFSTTEKDLISKFSEL